ncbi:L1 [Trematomus bernacchii papillomavirus]|nr:L1 [Trematomus bernacchii papillomavirus]
MYTGGRVPVALEYTEGGIPTEPYVKSTDEFVHETPVTFIVKSDPIRVQGHPFSGAAKEGDWPPLVSPSRFNVCKVTLPDMSKLIMPPLPGRQGLDTMVPVWKVVGVRIDVQGVQTPAVTGFSQTTWQATDAGVTDGTQPKQTGDDLDQSFCSQDSENADVTNYRWGAEHAQRQMMAIGCKPLKGYSETYDDKKGYVRTTYDVSNGDLHEFGYGNSEHGNTDDLTTVPIEMVRHSKVLLPDHITMENDDAGDSNFMIIERHATGIRHLAYNKNPDAEATTGGAPFKNVTVNPDPLNIKTSGMVSSGNDLFNKSYWLNKAKGPNNGICWGNQLFVTFVDNSRGFIYRHTKSTESTTPSTYDPSKYKYTLRHIKEYQVTVIVRKCEVSLEARLITQLLQFNKNWLANLGFKFSSGFKAPSSHSTFHDVEAPTEEDEEEAKEAVAEVACVLIDCSGTATLHNTLHSHSHMARQFHSMNDDSTKAAPVKAAKKGPAVKRARK